MSSSTFDAQAAHRAHEEQERMIRPAEASTRHWSEIEDCTDQNRSILLW